MFYILMFRIKVALPEHRLQHLEHRAIVGHVQDQLYLLLLLVLGAGPVVRAVDVHDPFVALDLVTGPWCQGYEVVNLFEKNNVS
jgi:hypothetical protein